MQDDLTKFLSAVRKQDYRVDFKLSNTEVAAEPVVQVSQPEPVVVPVVEPEVVPPAV